MVEDACDGPTDAVIEPLGRVGVNVAADILALGVAHRFVSAEPGPRCYERLPLVAHQMGVRIDRILQHQFGFRLRQIGDHLCPIFPGRRSLIQAGRTLNNGVRAGFLHVCGWPLRQTPKFSGRAALIFLHINIRQDSLCFRSAPDALNAATK